MVIILPITLVKGQTLEGELRLGVALNRFESSPLGDQKNSVIALKSLTDVSLVLQSRISLSAKYKLDYIYGVDFANTRGYWPIVGWGIGFGADKRNLENLVYTKQRISVRWLGLEKRFNLIDEKLWFSANVVFLSRFYLGNEKRYAIDFKTNNEDWIEYRYDFRLYHNKTYKANPQLSFFDLYLSTEYGLKLGGVINDKLDWNFNMTYYRNLYNYYNFELDLIYHKILIADGVETPFTETYNNAWNQSFEDDKLIQREHYFALGFGVSYKF